MAQLNKTVGTQRSIKVILRGGLGNQLFQYFGALDLANELNAELQLDTSLLPNTSILREGEVSIFSNGLSSLSVKARFTRSKWFQLFPEELVRRCLTIYYQIDRKLGSIRFLRAWREHRFSNDLELDMKPNLPKYKNILINHAFLNPSVFDYPRNRALPKQLEPHQPSPWYLETLKSIRINSPAAIHVRLGDHQYIDPSFDINFYRKGIDHTRKANPDSAFWIFSDDPSKARGLMEELPNQLFFVVPPTESSPLESLLLMANCKTLLTSRSSYSWWAGTIGSHLGSEVVINKAWTSGERTPEFFRKVPRGWTVI